MSAGGNKWHINVEDIIFTIIIFIVTMSVTIVTLYPFLYILFYSLSQPGMIRSGLLLYPKGFTYASYKLLFTGSQDIPNALRISISRSILGPLLSLLVTSMGAYGLTKRDMPGRGFIAKYVLITMYFSSGMIPTYLLIKNLQLSGTFWVYIIPGLFSVFHMVLIRTYFENLPAELEESAIIDGAGDFTVFLRIVLPLSMPVLAAVTLFSCVGHWNAYVDNLLYNASNKNLFTLQYVLMIFMDNIARTLSDFRNQTALSVAPPNPTTLKMALTVITVTPILFVYPFLQRYFAKGILIGSIKG